MSFTHQLWLHEADSSKSLGKQLHMQLGTVTWAGHVEYNGGNMIHHHTVSECRCGLDTVRVDPPHRSVWRMNFNFCWNSRTTVQLFTHFSWQHVVPWWIVSEWSPLFVVVHLRFTSAASCPSHQPDMDWICGVTGTVVMFYLSTDKFFLSGSKYQMSQYQHWKSASVGQRLKQLHLEAKNSGLIPQMVLCV